MKTRIDAGTDVAMIGIWDVSRNDSVLKKRWGKEYDKALDADAIQGHLFYIDTGADGGGPIDVYVDEDVPLEIQKQTRRAPGEFLISAPTGQLVVGGVEDYRSDIPQITGKDSIVSMRPGDYLLQCYFDNNDESCPAPSEAELREALGTDDYRFYRKTQKRGCLMVILLFICGLLLSIPWGWKVGLPIAIVSALGYPHVEQWRLRRNNRYQRINKVVEEVWQRAQQTQLPIFVFQLKRVENRTGLMGGHVRRSWLSFSSGERSISPR